MKLKRGINRYFYTLLFLLIAVALVAITGSCGGGGGGDGGAPSAGGGGATLASIAVTPNNQSIATGNTQQFTATGAYSDGSARDITLSVTWGSSDTTVAGISNTGLSTAGTITAGSTTITASSGGISGNAVLKVIINLPKTGQVTSYAAGDDGDLKRGVAWPNPRFTNPDGTTPITSKVIVDQLTGLMWIGSANTPGPLACGTVNLKTWQEALNHVACLNTNSYLGYNDWRLPNVNELESLVHTGYNEKDCSGSGGSNPCATNAQWLISQGLNNVQATYYWSSSNHAIYTSYAWFVMMDEGKSVAYFKTNTYYVWPVRGGTP